MNIPNRVWLNPSDFPGGKPNQVSAYNRIYTYYLTEQNGTWCYVLVGVLKSRRKSVPTPPPTPCLAPTIVVNQNITIEVVANVGTINASQVSAPGFPTGGVPPYSYALSKDNITYTPYNTNPALVTLSYDCNDVGTIQQIYLSVKSNCPPFDTSDFAIVSVVQILNTAGDCP